MGIIQIEYNNWPTYGNMMVLIYYWVIFQNFRVLQVFISTCVWSSAMLHQSRFPKLAEITAGKAQSMLWGRWRGHSIHFGVAVLVIIPLGKIVFPQRNYVWLLYDMILQSFIERERERVCVCVSSFVVHWYLSMAWAIVQKICETFLPELIGLQPDSWRISNGKREPQTDGKQDVYSRNQP